MKKILLSALICTQSICLFGQFFTVPQLREGEFAEFTIEGGSFYDNNGMSAWVQEGVLPEGLIAQFVIDSVGLPRGSDMTYEEFVETIGEPRDLFGADTLDIPFNRINSGFRIDWHLYVSGYPTGGDSYGCEIAFYYLLIEGFHMGIGSEETCYVDLIEHLNEQKSITSNLPTIVGDRVDLHKIGDVQEVRLVNEVGVLVENFSLQDEVLLLNKLKPGMYFARIIQNDRSVAWRFIKTDLE